MSRKGPLHELCSIDADGRVTDEHLHAEILDNPEADRLIAREAIKRAVRRGLSRELAEQFYGIKD